MKIKRCILCLLILLLILTLCSCRKSENNQEAISQKPYKSENNQEAVSLEPYKSVLENKAAFFSIDDKRNFNLNEFLNGKLPGTPLTVTRFTILDMDGDKIPEVALELSVNNSPEYYEVLKYMDNTVYGYNFVYRALMQLKTDGTFNFSNGAADVGYGKLQFSTSASEIEKLGYSESSYKNDALTISYFINQQPVSEESFKSFSKEQNGKRDVVWYEFTQQNIEKEFKVNDIK